MIEKKQCENKECGKDFYGTKRAKFCSDKCRVTNWRNTMKKRKVEYTIYGENDAVLKQGECFARYGEYEMQDICDHANIDFDDVWSMTTTNT
jgi:hypothetical protein